MDNLAFLNNYGFNITYDDIAVNSTKKVLVGMSGGVDSSVSAALLKMMGYQVIGVFMKNWNKCQSDDYEDIVRVCHKMNIDHYYHIDLSDDYYRLVFEAFLSDLNHGLTPNPDILCNKHIKFDIFYNLLDLFSCDYLATGHYAKIVNDQLSRPLDSSKDQSYFLHAVNPKVWPRVIFPLGNLPKKTVREIASKLNLHVSSKKDSTGICFIGNNNYQNFIKDYISSSCGNICLDDGTILGVHKGLFNYTVGQKRNLGLDFHKKVMVIKKDMVSNSLIVALDGSASTKQKIVKVRDFTSTISGRCNVRFSNLGIIHTVLVDGSDLILDYDISLIAPGQAAVFYDDTGIVLGGAVVT